MFFTRLLLSATMILLANSAAGKGLDSIQPTEEKTDSGTADEPTKDKAAKKKDLPAKNKPKSAGKTGKVKPASTSAIVKDHVKPSAFSKSIANKLHLSTSYGFIRIPKVKIGSMSAQGVADFAVLWNFLDRPDNKYKLLATFRYAPVHSENEIDGQSYNSIIEGLHAGVQFRYRFLHNDLELVAGTELGYLLVYQDSRDKYSVQEDSENNELAYTLGTGFEWILMDKVSVGPRLYAGFGAIQIVQASAAFTFTF